MKPPKSKLIELMTANAELMSESEWNRIYKGSNGSEFRVSNFLDDNFSINAATLRDHWPKMSTPERKEFCSAFACKNAWGENETAILDVILDDGNDDLWQGLALTFLKHPNRQRIVDFLIERLQFFNPESRGGYINYIQALGLSGEHRASNAIKPFYLEFKRKVETEAETGIPKDVVFGPIPYAEYFFTSEALVKLDDSPEYKGAIRKYFDHPNEQVRYWAEHALGVEGPTTQKRNAEYGKRFHT